MRTPFTSRSLVFSLLCIVSFLVPFETLLSLRSFQSVIFLVSAVALGVAVVTVAFGSQRRRIPVILSLLGVFILWCCCSFVWTVNSAMTLQMVITYSSLLLFTWMIWEFTDTQRQYQWLLLSYVIGCSISLAMLFAAYAAGMKLGVADETRYAGAGMNANGLALIVDIGILAAAYLASRHMSKLRIVYWLFVLLASLGVLLTGSRAGTIGLVAAIGTTCMLTRTGIKRVVMLSFVIGCLAWLVPRVVPAALRERIMEGRNASTFVERQRLWRAGLECWDETPILGVGAGGFVTAISVRHGRSLVAHNTFVQILVENGIIGIGLMLIVWGLLARMALRLPQDERILSLGVLAIWVIASMSGSTGYDKYTWLVYAWITVQSQIVRESWMLAKRQRMVPEGRPPRAGQHSRHGLDMRNARSWQNTVRSS